MKSFYNLIKKSKGFSLLEVLIAVFILLTGVVGAYSVFGNMASGSSMVSKKMTAAYLAQEGVETVRNIRDANWINNTTKDPALGWAKTVADFNSKNCQGTADNSSITGYSGGCEADYITGGANEVPGSESSLQQIGSLPGRFLYIDAGNNSYSYNTASGGSSGFTRQIIINPMNINGNPASGSSVAILDVIVNVYWQDRGINYHFLVEEFLYNWDE